MVFKLSFLYVRDFAKSVGRIWVIWSKIRVEVNDYEST